MHEFCQDCSWILKLFKACPRGPIDISSMHPALLEIIMVILSIGTDLAIFFVFFCFLKAKNKKFWGFLTAVGVAAHGACLILKRIFKDPRPNLSCSKSFGFPSNHSAFSASQIIFSTLELARFKGTNLVYISLGWIIFFGILLSRYFLHYHSITQIVAGSILGALAAISGHLARKFYDQKIRKIE